MTKICLSDYVAQLLVDHGVRHAFMLTGSGAMHLNGALDRAEGPRTVFCYREQALAITSRPKAMRNSIVAILHRFASKRSLRRSNYGIRSRPQVLLPIVSGAVLQADLLVTPGS